MQRCTTARRSLTVTSLTIAPRRRRLADEPHRFLGVLGRRPTTSTDALPARSAGARAADAAAGAGDDASLACESFHRVLLAPRSADTDRPAAVDDQLRACT
jgi:hypothetical protein